MLLVMLATEDASLEKLHSFGHSVSAAVSLCLSVWISLSLLPFASLSDSQEKSQRRAHESR